MTLRALLACIAVSVVLVLGAGCGDDSSGGGGDLKVGFVYVAPIKGSTWSESWETTRAAVEDKFGAETTAVAPIAENTDVVPVLENLIRDGNQVIFAAAFGYQPFVAQVARQNPDVDFVTIGPWTQDQERPPNVAAVEGNLLNANYAAGFLAGSMSDSNTLGFSAGYLIPDVVAGIDTFQLGAMTATPSVQTRVAVLNNWYDPPRATQAAKVLAARGADVIGDAQDSSGTLLGAEEAGVYGVGTYSSLADVVPKTYLTGVNLDWNDYAYKKIQQHVDGNFVNDDFEGDLANGLVTLGPVNDAVPDDIRQQFDDLVQRLTDGDVVIFKGPLEDNEGNVVLNPGEELRSATDIYKQKPFFVKGVIGTL